VHHRYLTSKFLRLLYGVELKGTTGSSVPLAVCGENRERPLARNPKNAGAAIRYALVIFLP
jgi:hypothetical protein